MMGCALRSDSSQCDAIVRRRVVRYLLSHGWRICVRAFAVDATLVQRTALIVTFASAFICLAYSTIIVSQVRLVRMSHVGTQQAQETAEVKEQLEFEIRQRKELEVLISEKESEAQCAVGFFLRVAFVVILFPRWGLQVAWAQTASDTVSALEEQLEVVESELDKALNRLQSYESDECVPSSKTVIDLLAYMHCSRNPWRFKEESFRHILQQLTESQTREAEMFQQAEDMQVCTVLVFEGKKRGCAALVFRERFLRFKRN